MGEDRIQSLKPKHRLWIRLYKAGHSFLEIGQIFGSGPDWIREVVLSEKGKAFGEEIENDLRGHFKNLFGKYYEVIKNGMMNPDPRINLAAASLYSRSPFAKVDSDGADLTAEDVVQKMLDEEANPALQNTGGNLIALPGPKLKKEEKKQNEG
jgi:hypothetical protein